MKKLMSVVGLCLLFAASSAFAEVTKSFRAQVVSVDVGTKTIIFRVPNDATPTQWSELVGTWNEATVWERSEKEIYKSEPATAALATSLKKDAKVYAIVSDNGSNESSWTLQSLDTIPPDSTIP